MVFRFGVNNWGSSIQDSVYYVFSHQPYSEFNYFRDLHI
ncbi:Uncharacterised protein [Streptococcus pneumoniae]|nr:Uncharacterised protein [Streptococcus pneumoniae]